MRTKLYYAVLLIFPVCLNFSCQKENIQKQEETIVLPSATQNQRSAPPPFNLQVILRGEGKRFGHVKFRQHNDADKIITLDTWVRDLEPGHEYQLQRAVDPINVIDGNCTSTTWLTLGKGLVPQTIFTDDRGTGREDLWRSVAMLATGSMFDIHFQVIDAVSKEVVLTGDCYQYTVR